MGGGDDANCHSREYFVCFDSDVGLFSLFEPCLVGWFGSICRFFHARLVNISNDM